MKRTKTSLYYLAAYLLSGGVGFLLIPQAMLRLFMSNGTYHDLMVRLVGVLMIALGILIVQIIRKNIKDMYAMTLVVRGFILVCLVTFFFVYGDPLMLVLTAIVALGFIFTFSSYLLDRRQKTY